MVGVHVSINLKLSVKKQWQPANRFATDLNEREVIELVENATPGSMKQATKYGVKIFQGKNLKTLFLTIKHPS